MNNSPCDKLVCILIRFMFNYINVEEYKSEIASLLKEDVQILYLKELLEILPKDMDNFQKRICWTVDIFKIIGCYKINDEDVVLGKSYRPPPIMALLKVIESVECDDRVLFSKIVQEYYTIFTSCKAICIYLQQTCSKDFNNPLAATIYNNSIDKIDYCHIDFDNDHRANYTDENIEQLFHDKEYTYGYKTILKYGNRILNMKELNEKKYFTKNIIAEKQIMKMPPTIITLRRYNSYTPIIEYKDGVGGGYLFWSGKEGIVIDPGFHFMHNIYEAKIPFNMIKKIIITHAHPDHLADLPSILTMIHEWKLNSALFYHTVGKSLLSQTFLEWNENNTFKPIDVYVNVSSFKYLSGILDISENNDEYKVHIMHHDDFIRISQEMILMTLPTIHKDCISKNMGVGILLKSNHHTGIVYTSDTSFDKSLPEKYSDILKRFKVSKVLLIANLGGLHRDEQLGLLFLHKILRENTISDEFKYKNHLGIIGLGLLINFIKPSSVILGEIGSEFKGIHEEIEKSLNDEFKIPILMADLGLSFNPFNEKCYSLAINGSWKYENIKNVIGIEKNGNTFYINKEISDPKQMVHLDDWRNNIPIRI